MNANAINSPRKLSRTAALSAAVVIFPLVAALPAVAAPTLEVAQAASEVRKPIQEGKHDRIVRPIPVKGLPRDNGRFDKPAVINSDNELEQIFKDKELQERLKKEIDFREEKLLFFAWSGSGGDKLGYRVEKNEVVFEFKPGFTKDFRPHGKLYALDKGAKYRVEKVEASLRDKERDRTDDARKSEKSDRY